ncbi:DUF6923 family protein [Larkinella sp. VNQ87]|uniref:DUF6923 family protein n=1 Tax=Larkinella sp. VNQ87 TaxID=3400921 RepID=UPI003C0F136B
MYVVTALASGDGSSDLQRFDYTTNTFTNIDATGSMAYNALGYNQVDNYLYGFRYSSFEDASNRDGTLLRVGANGVIEDLGYVIGFPSTTPVSADVSPTGIMYVHAGVNSIYAINLNSKPYTAVEVPITSSIFAGDWAINPADNQLYSVDLSGRVEKINPTTGTVTFLTPANGLLPATNYAAIWFDQFNNMYAFTGTQLVRYNLSANSWSTVINNASFQASRSLDGAACPIATVDPQVTKVVQNQSGNTVTFDIALSNNGPAPAADVNIRDVLPVGIVFQNAQVLNANNTVAPATDYSLLTPAVGANGTVLLKLNNLSVGAANRVVLRLTVKATGGVCNQTITNCAEIISAFGQSASNGTLGNTADNTTTIPGDVAANNEACAPVSFSLTPAAPTATASASAVCSGQSFSITYSNVPADGTLIWTRMPDGTSGTGNVSQALSNTTTAPISYTYTSTIQNLYNCPSPPTVTVVTVNPTPIITPSNCTQTICVGETGVISFTSTVGGTTINWLRVDNNATGTGDISESFTTPGTYTYKIWGTSPAPASCPVSNTITCTIVVRDDCSPCSLTAVAGIPVCDPGNATYSVSVTATDATGLNVSSGTVTGTAPEFTVSGILARVDVIITPLGSCTNASPITVTAPNCCSIATPSASVTSQPICNQPTGTITVTSPLTGVTYSFDGGLTFQASNVKSGLAAGTNYNIVVKDDITGCLSDAVTLTVNPVGNLRATASSNSPVCSGNLLQLIASQTGGSGPITYSWAGPNGFNSTLQNPSIASPTAAAGGSYTVTVTDATCSVTATTAVTIATQPDLAISGSPTLTICSGQSTVLNISGDGGANVVWTNTLGETGTGTTINFGGILNVSGQPQTIVYFVKANAGGCSDSTSVWLTINPAPALQVVPSRAIYCALEETNIVATASSGTATITWTRLPAIPDPPTPSGNGAGSATINQPLPAGSYTYTITATENGCSSTPAIIPITVNN